MAEQGFTRNIIFRLLEDRSFILALVIIGSYIIISALTIFYLREVEVFREVSLVYVGWVGGVIGYFFGSKQVDRMIEKIDGLFRIGEERVKELEEEKRKYDQKNEELRQLEAEMTREHERAKAEVDRAKDFIEILKKRFLE